MHELEACFVHATSLDSMHGVLAKRLTRADIRHTAGILRAALLITADGSSSVVTVAATHGVEISVSKHRVRRGNNVARTSVLSATATHSRTAIVTLAHSAESSS